VEKGGGELGKTKIFWEKKQGKKRKREGGEKFGILRKIEGIRSCGGRV
jgi:hypothetical protein